MQKPEARIETRKEDETDGGEGLRLRIEGQVA